MSEVFKLPVSSYEEVMKVIAAYGAGRTGVSVSLDDLVKVSSLGRTVLSKNNGFLIQTNLISKGNKKAPTELCKKLSDAYSMGLEEEVSRIWREIVESDEFMSKMISVVSVKKSISRQDYVKHIVYSSGCGNSATYKAGAGALIEIFKITSAIDEENGNIVLCGNYQPVTRDIGSVVLDSEKVSLNNNGLGPNVVEEDKKEKNDDSKLYIQQYTCESGQIAKIIIPENATEDDLLGFHDMLNIALKRKFKISLPE